MAQGLAFGHARPERPQVAPFAEGSDARQAQVEGRGGEGAELGVKVGRHGLGNFAEEPEGDVQGVERAPARAGQALLAARQPLADLRRRRNGREQPDHALAFSPRMTIGASRAAMIFTPRAFGWRPSRWFRPGVSATPARRSG